MTESNVRINDRSLLIVDDDTPLRTRLARAMESRGFTVAAAESVAEGVEFAMESPPAYAVIDLRLDDGNGFEVVQAIQQARPDCRIRHADGVWQHRHGGCRDKGGCRRLSAETGECGRHHGVFVGNGESVAGPA